MHRNKSPMKDAYAVFYIDLPLVNLAKMKHQYRRHSAVFKPQARIARSENRADTWLWGRAETSVSSVRCCRLEIAEISVYSRVGQGLAPSVDEVHEISQTPTSHLEVEHRSIGC